MVQAVTSQPSLPNPPPRLTVFDTGSEQCPQGQLPGPIEFDPQEARNALNPLQYVPVVGMIYRQATGETIPAPLSIAGSVVTGAMLGGPLGILGSVLLNFASELVHLGADTSRPPVPYGMKVTGNEAGIQTGLPGETMPSDGYTTLATVLPQFLGGGGASALAGDDTPATPAAVADDDTPIVPATPVRQAIAAYEAGSQFGMG
jgi:hypothetical protein